MPVVSDLIISTISFNAVTGKLILTGIAFGENQYGVSNIEYRKSGVIAFTPVASVDAWADSQVEGTISALPLAGGQYDVRVTNSDNEQYTYSGAFSLVAGSASQVSHRFGIGGMGF